VERGDSWMTEGAETWQSTKVSKKEIKRLVIVKMGIFKGIGITYFA
jgi:hypothetical protein